MKSLSKHMKEELPNTNRKYHLSYDTIDCKKDFEGDYDAARKYLLCVLANTPFITIESFNNSCMILTYEINQYPKLFIYLNKYLKSYFYYSISLVARTDNGAQFIQHNQNKKLNKSLQDEINSLSCDNYNNKIDQY